MSNFWVRQILLFILLVFLQVMLFNKIHLFGFATPLLYIYFAIKLPIDMSRNAVVALAALMGLLIDIFSYTLGLNMLAMTVMGFSRFYLLKLFGPRDVFEANVPSFSTFGKPLFLRYTASMTLCHHIILFTTESLSLFDPLMLLLRIVGSFILTMILIFAFEIINFDFLKK